MTPVCASLPKSSGSVPPCRPLGNIRGSVRGPAMPSIHSVGCRPPLVALPHRDRLNEGRVDDARLRDADLRLDLLDDLRRVAVRLRGVERERLPHLRVGERLIVVLALQQRHDRAVAGGALEP